MFEGLKISAAAYAYSGAAAYLIGGFFLTRSILKSTTMRLSFRDVVFGSVFMPILFVFFLLFELMEEAWKRLLLTLDFDAPEEMRAGPVEPADDRKPDGT